MEKDNEVITTINSIFNDENFLLTAAISKKGFDNDQLCEILTIVLNYYITTRDTSQNITVEELKDNYQKLNNHHLTEQQLDNIITNGFLTHSFCGVERKYISKYGFDYWDKISESERMKLLHIRNCLKRLEYEVGKNPYLTYRESDNLPEIVEKEVFMTFPGSKTIHYSQYAPERLYLGPIGMSSFSNFPMIAGESKKDYLTRILKYKIETCTYNIDQDELLEVAKSVIDYYTQKQNCISFINIKDIINKPIYTIFYENGDDDHLKKYCKAISSNIFYAHQVFTKFPNDRAEGLLDIGNLVILSTDIPVDSLSFADFPNLYDLKQKYLKQKGISEGTLIEYETCQEIKETSDLPKQIKKLYK